MSVCFGEDLQIIVERLSGVTTFTLNHSIKTVFFKCQLHLRNNDIFRQKMTLTELIKPCQMKFYNAKSLINLIYTIFGKKNTHQEMNSQQYVGNEFVNLMKRIRSKYDLHLM